MIDWTGKARALADHLAASGHLMDNQWRQAFQTIPRHLFVPRFWHDPATLLDGDDPGPAGVVRKSLGPNTVTEGGQLTVAYTHRLTAEDLADLANADATATQAQQWVNKTHEARVVVVGQRMFTILIRAGSPASRVDWRADYPALSYEWVDTPPEVEKGLRAYLAEMGLAYAAVDFAIDVDGRWVFLEPTAQASTSGSNPILGRRSPTRWLTC
jgi:hypothetical protein